MKIFPVFYFPPISWFSAAIKEESLILEQNQHFRRQNLCSRTRIKTANGPLNLSIPAERTGDQTPYCKKGIASDPAWQTIHWKSLESAYRRSPFFEYYEDLVRPLYKEKASLLFDFNLRSIEVAYACLGLDPNWKLSETYLTGDQYEADFREAFDPTGKKIPPWFEPKPYQQVFGDFDPDLSIMDLIFNVGPETGNYF